MMPGGEPRILILGGWSPGPLNHLKNYLQHRNCVIIEPNIPMPPMGCSWCCDISMLVLLGVVGLMVWGCQALAASMTNLGLLIGTCILLVAVSLVLIRLCVAWLVRRSIDKGVHQAKRFLPDAALVIGFSWGGCVVAELLRRECIGEEPAAILIAPTTALVATVALHRDVALDMRIQDSTQVHVFQGRHDQAFCPHADRWDHTGVTLHWCNDNHVFLRQESIQALVQTLAELLDNRRLKQ